MRAVVLISPNNPTGAVYPPEIVRAIFQVCRERGVALVLDETYRDFLSDAGAKPHGLFDEPDWRDTLVELYSFSKSFCIPGHRLGAVIAGERLPGGIRQGHGLPPDLRAARRAACAGGDA